MFRRTTASGFSLIEVILSVGIFALAVPTSLALLAALGRQGAASTEMLVAHRLAGSVRVELGRLAQPDFEGFAATVPVMTSAPGPGLALVATSDGSKLLARDDPPSGVNLASVDRYFLIECWRFEKEPLRFDSGKAYLALAVRVTWPYQLPNGTPAARTAQTDVAFTVVLNR